MAGVNFTVQEAMSIPVSKIGERFASLRIPEIELEGWWTSLNVTDEEVIALYPCVP